MDLEHPLIKAPYEGLNKVFRNSQKAVEKEVGLVVSSVADIRHYLYCLLIPSELHSKKDTVSKEEAHQTVDKLLVKLQGLKRKVISNYL